ncbi:histidine phosphatase family protein [Gryllotalpicola protaetiae]|uniref:Histidine phosphatase family protein n=1 Tax=Gryllotalpicola protaetiae TaxID=2419771 RepID=A0A387BMJ1_9MICO|nr:histidine phosphatase family protein [Gryllotalpicola protaetiae]AYG02207.1 histidine phosphatase family protein [Gryllotalpicola protaetiae]
MTPTVRLTVRSTRPGEEFSEHGGANKARLVLVRHGQTEWSLSGRHTSVTDLPLTAAGEAEAAAIAEVLNGHLFGLVLSSPRHRAIRTAELAGYGDRLVIDDDLAEFDYGAYEGLTTPQIIQQRGANWNLWRNGVPAAATPGESAADVQLRAKRVIARALDTMWSGQDVICFAHGHFLRAMAAAWLGLRPVDAQAFSLATATVSVLGFEHAQPVVVRWNTPPGMLQFPSS